MKDNTTLSLHPNCLPRHSIRCCAIKHPPLEVIPILLSEARRNNFEAAYCLSLDAIFPIWTP
jgi:hypothetical protein